MKILSSESLQSYQYKGVTIYYDRSEGAWYVYTESKGRGRMDFESDRAAEEYIDSITSASTIQSSTYTLRTDGELIEQGYELDNVSMQSDIDLCKENKCKFIGYATDDSGDRICIVAEVDGQAHCYEESHGRLYEIDETVKL